VHSPTELPVSSQDLLATSTTSTTTSFMLALTYPALSPLCSYPGEETDFEQAYFFDPPYRRMQPQQQQQQHKQ
jgi:hypothetical protein